MTPAVSIRLVIRWLRLLLFSWRLRSKRFVQNASIIWIENGLLSPIMRRTRQSRNTEDEESFESPEPSGDETSYNLRYENGNGPSTSRAAAASRPLQNFARKSTSHGPEGRHFEPIRSRSQQINTPPSGSSRRKQTIPKKRRDQHALYIREVRRLQNSTELLLPKAPFGRVVREIMWGLRSNVNRLTLTALQALQEATEIYITQTLSDAYLLTQHRQRKTLTPVDIQILRVLNLIE